MRVLTVVKLKFTVVIFSGGVYVDPVCSLKYTYAHILQICTYIEICAYTDMGIYGSHDQKLEVGTFGFATRIPQR